MSNQRYYLDCNATTPVAPQVARAMMKCLAEVHGNPSSLHHEGRHARKLMSAARAKTASLFGVSSSQVLDVSENVQRATAVTPKRSSASKDVPEDSAVSNESVKNVDPSTQGFVQN